MMTPPQLMFSLGIFAGVNGEISGRARSDPSVCHFETEQNTTLMNQCGAGRRESDARALSAPQNHTPIGTVNEGRHPVSKVNVLIISF